MGWRLSLCLGLWQFDVDLTAVPSLRYLFGGAPMSTGSWKVGAESRRLFPRWLGLGRMGFWDVVPEIAGN